MFNSIPTQLNKYSHLSYPTVPLQSTVYPQPPFDPRLPVVMEPYQRSPIIQTRPAPYSFSPRGGPLQTLPYPPSPISRYPIEREMAIRQYQRNRSLQNVCLRNDQQLRRGILKSDFDKQSARGRYFTDDHPRISSNQRVPFTSQIPPASSSVLGVSRSFNQYSNRIPFQSPPPNILVNGSAPPKNPNKILVDNDDSDLEDFKPEETYPRAAGTMDTFKFNNRDNPKIDNNNQNTFDNDSFYDAYSKNDKPASTISNNGITNQYGQIDSNTNLYPDYQNRNTKGLAQDFGESLDNAADNIKATKRIIKEGVQGVKNELKEQAKQGVRNAGYQLEQGTLTLAQKVANIDLGDIVAIGVIGLVLILLVINLVR